MCVLFSYIVFGLCSLRLKNYKSVWNSIIHRCIGHRYCCYRVQSPAWHILAKANKKEKILSKNFVDHSKFHASNPKKTDIN